MYHKLAYRTTFQGMPISIENRAGSNRYWHDPNSDEKGKTKMLYPYGYVRGTMGLDGDEVDVFIGPEKDSDRVYVITQMLRFEFKDVDEQKVMLGFKSSIDAKTAYLRHYDNARFFGNITEMTVDKFKEKLTSQKGKLIKSSGDPALYIGKDPDLYIAKSNINI